MPAGMATGSSPSGSVGCWRLLDLDRDNTIRCPSTPYGGTTVKSNPLCWTDASGERASQSFALVSQGRSESVVRRHLWGSGVTGDSGDRL